MRPACVFWRVSWFHWAVCEQVAQSPHGRDGHASFFCGAKSNFGEILFYISKCWKNHLARVYSDWYNLKVVFLGVLVVRW